MISEKLNQQLTLSFPVNTEGSEGLSENLERVEKKSLVEWVREDLSEKLHLPEYYLYSLVLEYLESEDLVEVRKQFKQVLVLEKRSRGIEVMGVSEDQVSEFLNPEDSSLKLERSGLLLQRTRDRIRESLECESPLSFLEIQREVVTEMVQEEACLEVQPLSKEYFETEELVRRDLEGFAEFIKIGLQAKEKSMKYLSTGNPHWKTEIQLSNGEKKIWITYLNTVAREMKFLNDEDQPILKKALNYLLELVGVKEKVEVELNREYFENMEWVKKDLEGFAGFIEIGRRAKEKSMKYLSTGNPNHGTKIQLSNGEEERWETYLNTVARAMGFLNDKGQPIKKKALNYLLELTGVKEKVIVELNREYFENVEWVKQDLEGFAGFIKIGQRAKEKSVKYLSTGNPQWNTEIQLSNGEEKTWVTYLDTVARVMGFFRESGNPDRKKALNYLLELLEAKEKVSVELNREYFENVEWVKKDLEGFAGFIKIGRQAKEKSMKYLSTGNPNHGTKIQLSNGEEKTWGTYLKTICREMGFLNDKGEPIQKKALDYLLELMGVKENITVELNREYFENVEWVRQDLEGFAGFIEDRESGEIEKVIENLSTGNPNQGTKIQLSNGDKKSWQTYLKIVAWEMGFLNDKGQPIKKKALDYLKNLVLGNQEKDEGNENAQEKNLEALLTSTI